MDVILFSGKAVVKCVLSGTPIQGNAIQSDKRSTCNSSLARYGVVVAEDVAIICTLG